MGSSSAMVQISRKILSVGQKVSTSSFVIVPSYFSCMFQLVCVINKKVGDCRWQCNLGFLGVLACVQRRAVSWLNFYFSFAATSSTILTLLDFGVFFQCVRVPCMPGSAQASLERTVCCGLTVASVCLYCRVIALISDQVKWSHWEHQPFDDFISQLRLKDSLMLFVAFNGVTRCSCVNRYCMHAKNKLQSSSVFNTSSCQAKDQIWYFWDVPSVWIRIHYLDLAWFDHFHYAPKLSGFLSPLIFTLCHGLSLVPCLSTARAVMCIQTRWNPWNLPPKIWMNIEDWIWMLSFCKKKVTDPSESMYLV